VIYKSNYSKQRNKTHSVHHIAVGVTPTAAVRRGQCPHWPLFRSIANKEIKEILIFKLSS